MTWACFLSLTRSKLRLCSTNHRAGYFSNLACGWLSIVWAYSQQETENGPWSVLNLSKIKKKKLHFLWEYYLYLWFRMCIKYIQPQPIFLGANELYLNMTTKKVTALGHQRLIAPLIVFITLPQVGTSNLLQYPTSVCVIHDHLFISQCVSCYFFKTFKYESVFVWKLNR